MKHKSVFNTLKVLLFYCWGIFEILESIQTISWYFDVSYAFKWHVICYIACINCQWWLYMFLMKFTEGCDKWIFWYFILFWYLLYIQIEGCSPIVTKCTYVHIKQIACFKAGILIWFWWFVIEQTQMLFSADCEYGRCALHQTVWHPWQLFSITVRPQVTVFAQ